MRISQLLTTLPFALLAACKTAQPTVDSPPPQNPSERAREVEKETPPALRAEANARLAAAISNHPAPFLTVRAPEAAPSLRVLVGKPVSFDLAIPGIARWTETNVARFVARLPGGIQDTVPVDSRASRASYTFPTAGPAMLMLCVAPKDIPGGDAWGHVTHCSKVIIDVGDGRAHRVDEGDFTGETGLPLDVVPLVSPVRLSVGDELPVSFHFMNEEEEEAPVAAVRPDGSVDRQVTSRSGIAHFRISQPGRWVIRFVKEQPDGDRTGELVFAIPENKR